MTKPIAKSLHTVTVLVRVAKLIKSTNASLDNGTALGQALLALGLNGLFDEYELTIAARKQLDKGN